MAAPLSRLKYTVLTIANVTAGNQGTYTVVVANTNNSLLSLTCNPHRCWGHCGSTGGESRGCMAYGNADLADHSGYSPAGTHDGYGVTGAGPPPPTICSPMMCRQCRPVCRFS